MHLEQVNSLLEGHDSHTYIQTKVQFKDTNHPITAAKAESLDNKKILVSRQKNRRIRVLGRTICLTSLRDFYFLFFLENAKK